MKSSKLIKYKNKRKGFLTKKRNQRGGTPPTNSSLIKNKILIDGMLGESVVDTDLESVVVNIESNLDSQNEENSLFYRETEGDLKIDDDKIDELIKIYDDMSPDKYLDKYNFIKETYKDLKHKTWEEDINNIEMKLVNFHGCVLDKYYKVPENIIIVFLYPINNYGYMDYSKKKNIVNFFKNMKQKDFDKLSKYRSLISDVRYSFNNLEYFEKLYNGVLYSKCFLESTWYYPGQICPALAFSVDKLVRSIYTKKKKSKTTEEIFTKSNLENKNSISPLINKHINFDKSSKKIIFFNSCRCMCSDKNSYLINRNFELEYLIRNVNLSIERTIYPKVNYNQLKITSSYCGVINAVVDNISEAIYKTSNNNSTVQSKRNENFNIKIPKLKRIYDYIKSNKYNWLKSFHYAGYLSLLSYNKQILFLKLINEKFSKVKKNNFNKFYKDYLFYHNEIVSSKYEYMFNNYFNNDPSIFKFINTVDAGKNYFINGALLLLELGIDIPIKLETLPHTSKFDLSVENSKDNLRQLADSQRVNPTMNFIKYLDITCKNKKEDIDFIKEIKLQSIGHLRIKDSEVSPLLSIDFQSEFTTVINYLIIDGVKKINLNSFNLKIDEVYIINSDLETLMMAQLNNNFLKFINCNYEKLMNFDSRFSSLNKLHYENCNFTNVCINKSINTLILDNSNIKFINNKFFETLNELCIWNCGDIYKDSILLDGFNRLDIICIKNCIIQKSMLDNIIKSRTLISLHLENVDIDTDIEIDFHNLNFFKYIYLYNIPKLSLKFTTYRSINNFFSISENLICNVKTITVNKGLEKNVEQMNFKNNIEDIIEYEI